MARLTIRDARSRLGAVQTVAQCDPYASFHALPSAAVEALLRLADADGYRKPRNANGSRARYYHARLIRAAGRKES